MTAPDRAIAAYLVFLEAEFVALAEKKAVCEQTIAALEEERLAVESHLETGLRLRSDKVQQSSFRAGAIAFSHSTLLAHQCRLREVQERHTFAQETLVSLEDEMRELAGRKQTLERARHKREQVDRAAQAKRSERELSEFVAARSLQSTWNLAQ